MKKKKEEEKKRAHLVVVEIEDGEVGELRQERGGHLAQPSPEEVDSRGLAADGLGRSVPA
jgi:hypothetical protein